jgi:hypothetical protein
LIFPTPPYEPADAINERARCYHPHGNEWKHPPIIEKEPDVDEGQYDREESYQDYSHFAKRESKWMLQLRLLPAKTYHSGSKRT